MDPPSENTDPDPSTSQKKKRTTSPPENQDDPSSMAGTITTLAAAERSSDDNVDLAQGDQNQDNSEPIDTTIPENLTTGPSSKFLISKSSDFPTAVEALFAIEKEYPFLDVTTSIT